MSILNRRKQFGGSCSPVARLALLAVVAAFALLVQAQHEAAAGDTWIAASVASHHFDDGHHNETNPGLGIEHGIARNTRLVAGFYKNSLWKESRYAGLAWTPLELGPARLGLEAGVIDGYDANRGGFIPIAVLLAQIEHRRGVGVNVLFTPKIADKPAVLGFQIKFRLP